MKASEVASLAQLWSGEQNVGQTWTPSQWLQAVDRAQKTLVRDLKWPPSRFLFTSTPQVQEYQLQEVLLILRVYVNGQILPRTSIPQLEGEQLQVDDQSGNVGGPSGLVSPIAPPVVAGGQYTPAWTSAPPANYPASNNFLYGTTLSASPWFTGQRPMYYTRGGNVGLVPAPLTAVPVVCDVVRQPVPLQAMTDDMVLPDICADAMAWDACEQFYYSVRDQSGSSDNRNFAHEKRMEAMQKCKDWRKTYEGGIQGPIPLTYRTYYRKGQRRLGNDV